MQDEDEPMVVGQTLDASCDAVWRAITEIDQMRQWYFDNIPTFEAKVGFRTQFDVQCGGRTFPHIWTVTEVVPQERIVYRWQYGGYPGDSVVSFELFEQDNGTRLRLTHQVQESSPDDIPEFTRASGLAGSTYFIQQRLPHYLQPR
jgi:uncharacterized protein YndB with AHSA1/START domain